MLRRLLPALTLAAALPLAACADPATAPAGLATSEAAASRGAPKKGDAPIARIAIDAGFTELVGALAYVDAELDAGLVDLFLNGRDQYTVFAPTDAAFRELYALLGGVLGAPIDEITDLPAPVVLQVLQYHVAEGRRASNSVLPRNGERAIAPLLGERFFVRPDATIRDGLTGLREDAAIVRADLSASNGIVHVIDAVIVPPSVVAALAN